MTALDNALAAIFANPVMARDATLYPGGAGTGTVVRVILRRPDEISGFGAARVLSDTVLADLLIADAPDLVPGDELDLDGTRMVVQGEPERDAERLIWTAELVPA